MIASFKKIVLLTVLIISYKAQAAAGCNAFNLASLNECVAQLNNIQTINFTADITCSGVDCCAPSGGALIPLNGFSNKTVQGNNHTLTRRGSQKICPAIQIINSSRISVIGLSVDEDAAISGCAPTQNCSDTIGINGSNLITFESFGLYNAKAFGIGANRVSGLVLNNSVVSNTGIIGFYAGDNSSKVAVTNSTFIGTRTNAIAFQGVYGSANGDNLIQNNKIIDNHYQGQWLAPNGGRINGGQVYIPNASYVTVSGNTITGGNCAECYDTRVWGIELGKAPTPGSPGDVSHVSITQNIFSIQNGCSVFLNQGGTLDASTLVFSNSFYGSQPLSCAHPGAFPTRNIGQNTLNSTPLPTPVVTGYIDGVAKNSSGQLTLSGWACFQNYSQSINVDLYVGAPYGASGSVGIGRYLASQASEPAVASACKSTGGAYRFAIPISAAQFSNYTGKLIYLYGIAPVGGKSNLVSNSGVLKIPSFGETPAPAPVPAPVPVPTPAPKPVPAPTPAPNAGPVIGNIDGVFLIASGELYISGWACAQNSPAPITVHLYANGRYLVGKIVNAYTANVVSEPAVAAACRSTGAAYRFQILITPNMSNAYRGQTIYIHGISPNGGDSPLISSSGKFRFP